MRGDHCLNRVGDYLARRQRVFHTGMPHSDTVADGYRVELKGHAACFTNGLLDNLGNLVEMDVARHYLAETVGYADKGFADVSVAYAHGVQQRAVRGTLKAAFYCIASHVCLPFYV